MRLTRLVATLGVVAALLMAPVAAQALSFTVDASQVVLQGGSVGFRATLTLEPGDPDPLFLQGIAINLSGPGLTANVTPFFDDWPLQLDAGQPSVIDALLFIVSAGGSVPPGTYTGSSVSLTVDGGNDNVFDVTQPFEVTVRQRTPVPEPMTMALLGLGLAAVATRRKMQR